MDLTKPALRKTLKSRRLRLSDAERAAKSAQIVERLKQAVDWSTITTLHCYEPMLELHEVDIAPFVEFMETEYQHIALFTSRKIDAQWQIVPWKNTDALLLFDCIIVPMLGFDGSLYRLGYGGGYYDKLLAIHSEAKKIGVCFETGKLDHIPTEEHDVALDVIVTEKAQRPR